VRACRHPGMGCNHGALDLEHKENVGRFIAERLEITLSLGKDQVGLGETSSELLTAIVK
jgi:hypothetical protein